MIDATAHQQWISEYVLANNAERLAVVERASPEMVRAAITFAKRMVKGGNLLWFGHDEEWKNIAGPASRIHSFDDIQDLDCVIICATPPSGAPLNLSVRKIPSISFGLFASLCRYEGPSEWPHHQIAMEAFISLVWKLYEQFKSLQSEQS